jgi:hypothetical protein
VGEMRGRFTTEFVGVRPPALSAYRRRFLLQAIGSADLLKNRSPGSNRSDLYPRLADAREFNPRVWVVSQHPESNTNAQLGTSDRKGVRPGAGCPRIAGLAECGPN